MFVYAFLFAPWFLPMQMTFVWMTVVPNALASHQHKQKIRSGMQLIVNPRPYPGPSRRSRAKLTVVR